MRNIFAFISVSVDGFYADPGGGLDWQNLDDEFERFSLEQLAEVDTLLFGRVTYEGMVAFWPTELGPQYSPQITDRMNSIAKIVVSRTLAAADWHNTRLVSDNVERELAEVKMAPGRDIAIFGSSALTVNLLRMGLVDEVRLLINPIVLGEGQKLFHTADERIPLRLARTRLFDSGNVLLTYRPVPAQAT